MRHSEERSEGDLIRIRLLIKCSKAKGKCVERKQNVSKMLGEIQNEMDGYKERWIHKQTDRQKKTNKDPQPEISCNEGKYLKDRRKPGGLKQLAAFLFFITRQSKREERP